MMTEPSWTVFTDGRTFPELMEGLAKRPDCHVGWWTRGSLGRLRIKPKDAKAHALVLIRGSDLGSARNRRTEAIHREGARRRLFKPSPDAALLFRDALPMEVQEYRQIVFMHKPIRDLDQHPSLLCWERKLVRGTVRHDLVLLEAYPGTIWPRDAAFVFQASPEYEDVLLRPKPIARRSAAVFGGRGRPCWAI